MLDEIIKRKLLIDAFNLVFCDECACLLEKEGKRLVRYVLLVFWWSGQCVERRFCDSCAAEQAAFIRSIERIGGRVEWRETEERMRGS